MVRRLLAPAAACRADGMTDQRNTWTEAADAVLRRLWADGETTGTIAAHFRKTRNAVIGRVHRLHLPPRPSPIPGHIPALPKPTAPEPLPPPVVGVGTAGGDVAPVPLPTPPRMPGVSRCQYPIGHPRERGFRFCEAPVVGAGPYCPTHHAICWLGRARVAA
jgi:GcrA cell cycle regulator